MDVIGLENTGKCGGNDLWFADRKTSANLSAVHWYWQTETSQDAGV